MSRTIRMIQSYLIISGSQDKIKKYIETLCDSLFIHTFDRRYVEGESTTIGINDIRRIQKTLYLKPFQGTKKAVILLNAQNLTIAAQNALLKTLEEPPESAILILASSKKESFLQTILSRTTIIEIPHEKENKKDFSEYLNKILEGSISTKLKIAQDLSKNKEETLLTLEGMILSMRINLLIAAKTKTLENQLDIVRSLQQAYMVLSSSNVNIRLYLENLFLSF